MARGARPRTGAATRRLETDCCLTADGELVLLHEALLDLGTTVSGWAHLRTAAEVRAGWLRHHDGTPSDDRPLMLDELLDLALLKQARISATA